MPPRPIVLLAICLALLQGQPARSQLPPNQGGKAPPAKKAARTDRYGDPLPLGAVVRLGTERLVLHNAIFLTFSPDARLLAAHNGSRDLCVWDVATGKKVLRLETPLFGSYGTGMKPLAFSPDGKALALGCPDNTVRVWGVDTGKELHHFGGFRGRMSQLAFTPDGRFLLTGGYRGLVLCWDLARGGLPRTIGDFPGVVFLGISRDGAALTTAVYDPRGGQKRTFVRWDLATGKEIGRHSLTTEGTWDRALSPDGAILASTDAEGKSIALLDPLTGRERARAREIDDPRGISFSPDGTAVTCTSKDGTARVWDAATGKLRARFKALSTGINWSALSPGGNLLALAGRADDAVHIWDVAAARELHSFVGHRGGPLAVAFIGDGKEVATVSRDGMQSHPITDWADWSFRRWDAATGSQRAVINPNSGGEVRVTAFSADGHRVASVIHDGTLRVWDVEAGKQMRSWKVPTVEWRHLRIDPQGVQRVVSKGLQLSVFWLAFTPDGKALFVAEGGGADKLRRWDVTTGKELPPFKLGEAVARLTGCALSRDGRTLLVGVNRRAERNRGPRDEGILVDAAIGTILRRLEGIREPLRCPCFSPDGRTVAVDQGGAVSLWEVASGWSRGRLGGRPAGPGVVRALAFSPDGRLLAVSAGPVESVTLWDLNTGEAVGRLESDQGGIESLVFSPEGSRLAVAGYSPAALVCDVGALCHKMAFTPREPTGEELEVRWVELAGADAARAYRAVRRLAAAGACGAAFLKKRLQGGPAVPDERRIGRLVADLDHDDFAAREKASAELEALGPRAEPALRQALGAEVSVEARTRLKRLLDRLGSPERQPPPPELVRLRVLEALEANGAPEARKVLTELAAGPADLPLTREAKASLGRFSRRPTAKR